MQYSLAFTMRERDLRAVQSIAVRFVAVADSIHVALCFGLGYGTMLAGAWASCSPQRKGLAASPGGLDTVPAAKSRSHRPPSSERRIQAFDICLGQTTRLQLNQPLRLLELQGHHLQWLSQNEIVKRGSVVKKIALDCQKCGGTLTISPEAGPFQCEYCGMPYMVKQEGDVTRIVRLEEKVSELSADHTRLEKGFVASQELDRLDKELSALADKMGPLGGILSSRKLKKEYERLRMERIKLVKDLERAKRGQAGGASRTGRGHDSISGPLAQSGSLLKASSSTAYETGTTFDVVMLDIGPNKIAVIKAIRELRRDLGLKEAVDLVSDGRCDVLMNVSASEAQAAQELLEKQGAAVEIY